ncbi:hypothetical protein NUBL17186_33370 [Klebsiella quasipneumoniae]|nr:hypothetical protein KAM260_40410 [Klebsiella pneumoniae]GKO88604.1 hypothetical protein NUBL17186_33370 [Klebsiella quasipneumoniae]GLV15937.1 hypothetical protein KML001_09180 [Klebsiella quasipneumoniae subsp. similipneumoniae]GKP01536.1 hypothetical protein NUKP2_14240 [Klebsiella quasipneumoniae]GKP40727.1 hypothetical protein NUKP28_44520 [Klebsiella quasipneumoniae]
MLTTDGITFSSIGARLGICCALVAEDAVSAALAESGDNARPKLRASALIANVVFFISFNLNIRKRKLLCT